MNWLAKIIFFKFLGWSLEGKAPIHLKKAIFIVVPHTSWHDFYLGLLVRRIMKMPIKFVAKMELFRPPFGWYFKWMGGAPLDRTSGQNNVEAIAQIFKEHDEFRLAMSPEGTRKKVLSWKTGYYYIAMAANVPVICVAFDYSTKKVIVNKPFYPTGNIEEDTIMLRSFFKGIVGKKKEFS